MANYSKRPGGTLLVALLAAMIGCSEQNGTPTASPPLMGSYRSGVEAAESEIADGCPRIYVVTFWGSKGRDEETGLPVLSFGSCIEQPSPEYIRGHNNRIRQYVATTRPSGPAY